MVSSQALLMPNGAVAGFDNLAAALAGAADRFRQRKDQDAAVAKGRTQSLQDRAASAGINPAAMSDDDLTAAIAGKVDEHNRIAVTQGADERAYQRQRDTDATAYRQKHDAEQLQQQQKHGAEQLQQQQQHDRVRNQELKDASDLRNSDRLESAMRGDQQRRDQREVSAQQHEDAQYMQALQMMNNPNLDPRSEAAAHAIINKHDNVISPQTQNAPWAAQLDASLAGKADFTGTAKPPSPAPRAPAAPGTVVPPAGAPMAAPQPVGAGGAQFDPAAARHAISRLSPQDADAMIEKLRGANPQLAEQYDQMLLQDSGRAPAPAPAAQHAISYMGPSTVRFLH